MFFVGLLIGFPAMIAAMHVGLRLILPRRNIVDPTKRPVARYALASVLMAVAGGVLGVVALILSFFGVFALAGNEDGLATRLGIMVALVYLLVVVGSSIAFSLTVWLMFRSEVKRAWQMAPVPLATEFASYPPPAYGSPSYQQPYQSYPNDQPDAVDGGTQDRL